MKIMKILNHPTILSASPIKIEEGLNPYRIVLRKTIDQYGARYITHRENLLPKQDGDTLEWHHREFYWGHYFASLSDAEKDYMERI